MLENSKVNSLKKLGLKVSDNPRWVVLGTILITFLMVTGAFLSLSSGRSEMVTNINDMFPDYDEVKILTEIESDFGNVESFIILIKANDVLTPEVFKRTEELESRFLTDQDVMDNVIGETLFERENSFYSLPKILAVYKLRIDTGNFAPSHDEVNTVINNLSSGDDIRSLYLAFITDDNVTDMEKGLTSSLLPKNFDPYSSAKVESMVFLIALDGSLSDKELEEIELHMKDDIVNDVRGGGITMYSYAFGLLSASYAEAEAEMEPIFVIAIFAILIISMINYRRLSDALLANLTVLLVVIWTFCMIGILGFNYNLFNIMVPLLITGLAIDFSFHSIMGYRERLAGKGSAEKRVKKAGVAMISFVGVAFLLATITTAFGFLSNISSDLPAIAEFGIVAAFGIVFACILNLTFVPAVRILLDLRRLKKGKELKGVIPPKTISSAPGKVLRPLSKSLKYHWVIIPVLIILALPGYAMAPDMKSAYDPTGELLENQEITKAFRTLNEDYSVGTESILVRIDGDFEDPLLWQAVETSISNAGDNKYVATVGGLPKAEWVGPILPSIGISDPSYLLVDSDMNGIFDQDASSIKIQLLLDNLTSAFPSMNQYIHKGSSGYDAVLIRFISRTNLGEHGFDAKDELEVDFVAVYDTGAEIQYTGEPLIWNRGLDDFADSLFLSTILVLIFAFILLIAVFGAIYRSPLVGLLTAIPPIVVIGWTLSLMAVLNIPLNMMTAFVGALTVGLGIDYPIHLVTRWVDERKKGRSLLKCYTISMRSTGKELTFSAVTTLSAFVAFSLMPMTVMKQFGIVMVISIVFSLLGAVLMMPLLLRFWHREK